MDGFQESKFFPQKTNEMQPTTSGENRPSITTKDNVPRMEMNNTLPEDTLAAIVRNQLLIDNNQIKLMAHLAQLANSVEMLKHQVGARNSNAQAVHRTPEAHVEFKPVTKPEELDWLEEELKDETNMRRYVEKLSTICGTSGTSDGVDCAYRLIDYIATREMIHMCSWTGQARDVPDPSKNQPGASSEFETSMSKIPLKFYTKFRELFFRVIQLADHNFSEAASEKFLKCVMQNSRQRLNSKVMSARKKRPKNLKYRFKKDDEKQPE